MSQTVNPHGADWLLLKTMIKAEINELTNALLGPLDIVPTSELRGRIASLQWLLRKVEPTQTPTVKDVNYEQR